MSIISDLLLKTTSRNCGNFCLWDVGTETKMAALLLTYSNQFSCMKIVVTTLEQPHYLMLHAECEINLKLSNEILTKTLACHSHGRWRAWHWVSIIQYRFHRGIGLTRVLRHIPRTISQTFTTTPYSCVNFKALYSQRLEWSTVVREEINYLKPSSDAYMLK